MIELCSGNLLAADAEALVNTVNTQGIMGKGIALQFKKAFPDMFKTYEVACKQGLIRTGQVQVVALNSLFNPRFIINFPTKQDWRNPSRMEYIESGLKDLLRALKEHKIRSIAIPALGCGNGGLNWKEVQSRIEDAFCALPEVHVFLFPPTNESTNPFSRKHNAA
jgi:O-acetyl-ADP-ribose deacetylase (regulator of RNase III)